MLLIQNIVLFFSNNEVVEAFLKLRISCDKTIHQISLLCFDSDLTQAMGYQAHWYHRLMLFLIAATVVVSFQTVGALLVFGMLLAPAGVGALLARRIVTMMLWAAAVGVMSTYLGLLASYHFSWAAGASVVLTAVTIFFVVLVGVSVKKSLLGSRS